jgi:hypothetical protein
LCRYDEVQTDRPELSGWQTNYRTAARDQVLPAAAVRDIAAGRLPADTVHGTPSAAEAVMAEAARGGAPDGGGGSWCDASPTATHAPGNFACGCFEGRSGPVCSTPSKQYCVNDCAGRGLCESGFCACREGAFGADCSEDADGRVSFEAGATAIEAAAVALAVAAVTPEHGARSADHLVNGAAAAATAVAGDSRAQLRPRIYVYDLPPRFNVGQLQQRLKRTRCVWRYYDDGTSNETRWEPNLYGAELLTHELLLASPHRTTDPSEADYFFLPVYCFCFVSRLLAPIPKHHEHLKTLTPPGYPDDIGGGSAALRAMVLYQVGL